MSAAAAANVSSATSTSSNAIQAEKKALRLSTKKTLKLLSRESIEAQSSDILVQVRASQAYRDAQAVCVYLSMGGEADTLPVIRDIFEQGKRCFVPKITDKKECIMDMLEAHSLADIDSFPRDSWDIPDPPLSFNDSPRAEASTITNLGLILVPGNVQEQTDTLNLFFIFFRCNFFFLVSRC